MPDTSQDLIALIIGAFALACSLGWPLFRSRSAILVVQLGSSLGFGIQYALLDAWTGAAFCFLSAAQALMILRFTDLGQRFSLFALFALWPLAAVTWAGVPSLLAIAACSLFLIGRMQTDTIRLRLFQLAAAPFVMTYDVWMEAHASLISGACAAVIALFGLWRDWQERQSGYALAV